MTKFIPYPFFCDDVPIDISFVFEKEKPAGKHGFLKTQGRNFVFEDGTKVAFWGTNFNGAANFPEHAYAEKLAKRLSKIGINLVRFHQLDAEWITPNLFAFTKGKRIKDASFDPESLDRLDYLIACLKKEGIYCYMDMFTYRRFKEAEGIENAALLPDAGKPYCNFNEKMIALQKDLATRLWTHMNPYTKLRYCDDPCFVLAEIVNESDLFTGAHKILLEPYVSEFKNKLNGWLSENGIGKTAEDFDLENLTDPTLVDFKIHLQEEYYRTMLEHLHAIGVKIPITGTNWFSLPAIHKNQLMTDFHDTHTYEYDWRWGEFEKHCGNVGITQKSMSYLARCLYATSKDKPTYISEWDMPWPNAYRAESPVYTAAFGMFQGWSGFAIHTYSYSADLQHMDMLGKEISAEKIGGTPYRQGIFSTWNDPAKFGLFYHAALITRRGDVSPARTMQEFRPASKWEQNSQPAVCNAEKFGIVYDYTDIETPIEPAPAPETEVFEALSDTGELYRNWKKNYGYIDTPRTKCVYGFLGKNGERSLSGMKVECKTDFATIALSSLTDDGISSSDNMLLTTVGRAQNTDCKFEGDLMLDIGKAPVQIEVIEADIEIETSVENLRIWAISAEGYYIGNVPSKYEDGKFMFSVGGESQSMYYLIFKE